MRRNHAYETTTGLPSQVTTLTKADAASPATSQDDRYTYNAAGNITRVLDAASAIPGTTDGQTECYTYDARLRLATAFTTTGATCAAGPDSHGPDPYSHTYAYDAVGNVTALTDGTATATYSYPTSPAAARPNAVTSITRPSGTDTYSYDNGGHLTARNVSGTAGTFTWDPAGRLASATIGGQSTSMVYDASGERLIRRDPGGKTTLYLGGTELELSAGTVTAKRHYTAADGTSVAMREPGGLTWLLPGLHGSTQLAVADTPAAAVSRERHLPYGKRRGGDDLPFTDRGFLGKTEDASTGLTYLSARYYDPEIARFISPDPLLDLRIPQWANPYSYAGNNPIGMSDPTGLRIDTGNRKSDATFAKTHHPNGAKKSKTWLRAEKKHNAYLKKQRERAAQQKSEREAVRRRLIEKDRNYDRRNRRVHDNSPEARRERFRRSVHKSVNGFFATVSGMLDSIAYPGSSPSAIEKIKKRNGYQCGCSLDRKAHAKGVATGPDVAMTLIGGVRGPGPGRGRPPLKQLHPDSSLNKSSLDYWSKQRTADIVDSLSPRATEPLTAKPDGTIMQGNTRVRILRDRGYDVDSLPRVTHNPRLPEDGFWD
ncbi:RHS repeat-associated core domain-containing protein [Sinosporangium album]|uniref:RHS repeat-associated core domain-containing protein n=1 Tax=Sinosporangium album TaxID=504805 RepID=A0A1G8ID56_9ACTN|nr:RHS repeat-associated core domain-containing protein [Sinosporangium album]SDI16824.1 RHS repeat-associated core domain-containing protein [Sinosporangium album]